MAPKPFSLDRMDYSQQQYESMKNSSNSKTQVASFHDTNGKGTISNLNLSSLGGTKVKQGSGSLQGKTGSFRSVEKFQSGSLHSGSRNDNSHSNSLIYPSSSTITSGFTNLQKPLHKHVEIGGPKSPFSSIVRIPSSNVVGVIRNKPKRSNSFNSSMQLNTNSSMADSSLTTNNSKFSKLLQRWQTKEEQNNFATNPQSETLEYRFRPIISDEEKYQLIAQREEAIAVAAAANKAPAKKKKVYKMPVAEICFYDDDDDSMDSMSSMGYDGSEHDLDAVFQDAHLYPIHFDTRDPHDLDANNDHYFSGRHEEDYEMRDDDRDFEVREDDPDCDTRQSQKDLSTIQNSKVFEAMSIEKDPDLSVANSTIQKSLLDKVLDKDPDLSLDGDENVENALPPCDKEIVDDTCREKVVHENIPPKEPKKAVKVSEQDKQGDDSNTPPPLSEIYIPVSHSYGYGFYLKPVWTLENKKQRVDGGERLRKVRQLLGEGERRRSQRKLKRLVITARTE